MDKPQLERLTYSCRQLVSEVGLYIKGQLGKVAAEQIETKSLNSLVSHVDKTAEQRLVSGLQARLADATFLTEEETIETESGEYQWIVDPLDGTTNFLHQLPFFCISVALRHQEEILMGIVFEVPRGKCFWGFKGGGAWLEDQPIQVSKNTELQDAMIATGFPYYDYKHLNGYMKVLKHFIKRTRGIRRIGAAALDLAYVASGRYDAYFEYSLHPWDVAAGILLVEEAGGVVSDFKGGNDCLFGQEMVAGSPIMHPEVVKVIQKKIKTLS